MGRLCALQHRFKTLEMEGKKKRLLVRVRCMGIHRIRPKRELHEVRGAYGPEQQRELEGRHIR